jgi:hypothetical protein
VSVEVAEAISNTRLITTSGHGTQGERLARERYSVDVRGRPVVAERGVNGSLEEWRMGDEEEVSSRDDVSSMGGLLAVRRLRLRVGDDDSVEK